MTKRRVGFRDNGQRNRFFERSKAASGFAAWTAFGQFLGLRRNSLERYRYGQILLPEELFNRLLNPLGETEKQLFLKTVFYRNPNWGMVKGGQITFSRHPEIHARGRAIAWQSPRSHRFSLLTVDANVVLSEDLCELVGAMIGDGSVDGYLDKRGKSHYRLFFTGHKTLDREYFETRLSKIIRDLFGVQSRIYCRKDKQVIVLHFNSKKIFRLFTERFGFPAGCKTYTIKIPQEILDTGPWGLFPTLRGLFDTDGCFYWDKRKRYASPYPRITYTTVSQPLFEQLRIFLSNHFSIYATKNNRNAYCIEIYGKKQVEKWMELIGFSNAKHLNRYNLEINKPLAGVEPATTSLPRTYSTTEPQRR